MLMHMHRRRRRHMDDEEIMTVCCVFMACKNIMWLVGNMKQETYSQEIMKRALLCGEETPVEF
jgi:hypothetical protein